MIVLIAKIILLHSLTFLPSPGECPGKGGRGGEKDRPRARARARAR